MDKVFVNNNYSKLHNIPKVQRKRYPHQKKPWYKYCKKQIQNLKTELYAKYSYDELFGKKE